MLISALEVGFGWKFLHTLYIWLSKSNNSEDEEDENVYEEVAQWYQEWKKKFPPTILKHPSMDSIFRRALDMINVALLQGREGVLHFNNGIFASPIAPSSFDNIFNTNKSETFIQTEGRAKMDLRSVQVSFKDSLDYLAEQHGILFHVHPQGKQHPVSGKPLYIFGKLTIHLGDGVVWICKKSSSSDARVNSMEWQPISFEHLIELQNS